MWSGGAAPLADDEAPRPQAAAVAPALVAGNGDVALMTLLRLSSERGPPFLGFVQADRKSGLELLGQGAVLAAGAHAGGFPTHVDGERVARIHLVNREIGLLSKPGTKGRIQDLATRSLASRPPSAGIRFYLDEALRAAKLDPDRIHHGALLLSSHLEVVLAVASGRAQVGLATRAWGTRGGLDFQHLSTESYGLLVKARDLGDARVVRVCEVAQGAAFRSEVGAIVGYDVEGAGDIRYDD